MASGEVAVESRYNREPPSDVNAGYTLSPSLQDHWHTTSFPSRRVCTVIFDVVKKVSGSVWWDILMSSTVLNSVSRSRVHGVREE
jgi:hypothetical protein